ncbi:MAG: MerR family transcriptional regulator, partial [Planctomycetales bacterium]|nr:MerR family transcriptional regulator [Planctomycetales bacterium]
MAASADEPDTRPADDVDADGGTTLAGLRIVVLGRLASMSRRDATRLVRSHGGKIVSSDTAPGDGVDWLVLGEETFPNPALAGADDSLDAPLRTAIARGDVVVLSETQLWQRIGLVDGHEHVQRLYTPAMLAELLGVPVGVIRRWQRRGLIAPAREVQRLAYFDFREVATARRLAELLDAGMTPLALEARLAAVRRLLPDVERPLEQLSVIAEGKDLLLRQGGGLIDSGGQRRFDFDAAAAERVGSPRPAPRAESQGASDLSGDDP